MAGSFKARDGKTIKDGDEGSFDLQYGTDDHHEVVTVTGIIRRFDQVERVYDEEHIAVGKRTEEHWEIVTDDPDYPAVGILPENVLARSS